jgi:hypothetical protein
VEPQALVWALVGAIFGLGFAPPAGRVRALLVFVAVVLACALIGTWASEVWFGGAPMARNACAMCAAALFHPVLAAVVQAVPAILQAILNAKLGGGKT